LVVKTRYNTVVRTEHSMLLELDIRVKHSIVVSAEVARLLELDVVQLLELNIDGS
ncbi:23132_t:CDS:2, partial [Cetraspora pellucida]